MTVLTNEYQMASYNHYDTSGVHSVSNNFQQSAQMGPQAILDANGLGTGPGVVNNHQMAGINTMPSGIPDRVVDVGLNMQPQPTSGITELFGACKGLCAEVTGQMTPVMRAQINPQNQIASLDEPIVQASTPVMSNKFQPTNGLGA